MYLENITMIVENDWKRKCVGFQKRGKISQSPYKRSYKLSTEVRTLLCPILLPLEWCVESSEKLKEQWKNADENGSKSIENVVIVRKIL